MKKAEGKSPKSEVRGPKHQGATSRPTSSLILHPSSFTRIPWWLIAALLVLGTMAVYWPVTRCDFINYDDNWNLTDNVHVRNGLTWEGIILFLTDPLAPPGWSPLTMWSHMAICQVTGLNPWWHHLVNVVVHALNAALVFALLRQMTGAKWRSLWVAVFFAVHPLRVEAVAWVTQRRELLSVFFGLLALIAYVRYARSAVVSNQLSVISDPSSTGRATNNGLRTREHRLLITDHRLLWYWVSWFCGLLGIMSKPTLVSWPFLLLLLDYWPLGRWDVSSLPALRSSLFRLVREKAAFFVGVGCMSIGTFVVSGFQGVFEPGARLSMGARVGNALISYCSYLGKLFWPTDLAVIYPRPMHSPLSQVLLAVALLLGISTLVLLWPRRRPYLLIGWLWYCGTLVPVSQLVTVGAQAMADRWSYSPLLGVLIVVIWGAGDLVRGRRNLVLALSVAGVAVVVLWLAMTQQQLGYWKDSEVLFRHTVAVTKDNYYAYNQLGSALHQNSKIEEVTRQYQEAVRIKPDYPQGRINFGLALGQEGRSEEAIAQLREGLRLDPKFLDGHYLLGLALVQNGQIDEAIREFKQALLVNPDHADTHNDLGLALGRKGKIDEAILHLQTAVRLKPDHAGAHINLGVALGRKGQTDEAIREYQQAIRLKPDDADVHYNLGAALAKRGQTDEAIRHYQETIRLKPDRAEAHNNLGSAFYQQGRTSEAIREFQEALRLKPDYAEARKNLSVALAALAGSAPPPGAVTNR
jgi:protein O-mannosyl-transferase